MIIFGAGLNTLYRCTHSESAELSSDWLTILMHSFRVCRIEQRLWLYWWAGVCRVCSDVQELTDYNHGRLQSLQQWTETDNIDASTQSLPSAEMRRHTLLMYSFRICSNEQQLTDYWYTRAESAAIHRNGQTCNIDALMQSLQSVAMSESVTYNILMHSC